MRRFSLCAAATLVMLTILLWLVGRSDNAPQTGASQQLPIASASDGSPRSKNVELQQTAEAAAAVLEPLLDDLRANDREVRATAVVKLGIWFESVSRAVPSLVECLQDANANVREYAARALGQVRVQRAEVLPSLAAALQDPDPCVRVASAEAIYRLTGDSDATVPILSQALELIKHEISRMSPESDEGKRQKRDSEAAMIANFVLSNMGPDATGALEIVIELWKQQTHEGMRQKYAKTIAAIDQERAAELGIKIDEVTRPANVGRPIGGKGAMRAD